MLTRSETELTTAATDALLGLLCLLLAIRLGVVPTSALWKRSVWTAMLALLSLASLLGAVVHGVELRLAMRAAIWKAVYLALGLSIGMLLTAATYDGWGAAAAQQVLPWAVLSGILFFAVTELLGGPFLLFIGYEGLAALVALAIYVGLWVGGELAGASTIVIGIAFSLLAAAIQASRVSLRVGVRFDHNGLFHLTQMVGITILVDGVRTSLLVG